MANFEFPSTPSVPFFMTAPLDSDSAPKIYEYEFHAASGRYVNFLTMF